MNKFIAMGRLTRTPEIKETATTKVAKYTLAVDRRGKDAGTDFFNCTAFGKSAELAEKYFDKGTKILIEGRVQLGSYEKDGRKVYTTDVIIEQQEFAESKGASVQNGVVGSDFMGIPVDVEEELPFM